MPPTARLTPGLQLGPFTLDKRIAIGGMAEIWKASGPRAGRVGSLALKLARSVADEDAYARFQDELRLSCRLRHANVVTVYGGRPIDGWYVQQMELLDGVDLRGLVRRLERQRWRMPIPHVLHIGRCMARGLSYVHQRKDLNGQPLELVHRDISPHNVMVVRDGQVKLLDFGIAKARGRLVETQGMIAKGKASYMSPEQVVAAELDARSDIFSTGIVLWELLAGRSLFRAANDVESMRLIRDAIAPRLESVRGEVPLELADLVHGMLARHPDARTPNMRTVERGLSRVLARHFEPSGFGAEALATWLATVLPAPRARGTAAVPSIEP